MKSKSPQIPGNVYGCFVMVRMLRESQPIEIHCPKDGNLLYGEVLARGDGFDTAANQFRDMPPQGSIISFEESDENVEGHYFYVNSEEFRIVHLDNIIVSFPGPGSKGPDTSSQERS
jgi:hypothetical protein